MYIDELKEAVGEVQTVEEQSHDDLDCGGVIVVSDVRRVLLIAGSRALFYLTLLYNVVRNKIQSEFRWWDRVDEVYAQLFICIEFSLVFILSTYPRVITIFCFVFV